MPNGSSVAATEGACSASVGSWEMTCTSIGTASRTARLITDPRRSSLQARSPARAQHELRAVLGPGEVGERSRDVARDDLVVLASEVGEELSVAHEILRPRPGHSFGRTDVQAEQFAVRALRHARGPANQALRFPARR